MRSLPLTGHELVHAELLRLRHLAGIDRERKLVKDAGGYLLVDDDGGCYFSTLAELRIFLGIMEPPA